MIALSYPSPAERAGRVRRRPSVAVLSEARTPMLCIGYV
jgi:hypothetical protein